MTSTKKKKSLPSPPSMLSLVKNDASSNTSSSSDSDFIMPKNLLKKKDGTRKNQVLEKPVRISNERVSLSSDKINHNFLPKKSFQKKGSYLGSLMRSSSKISASKIQNNLLFLNQRKAEFLAKDDKDNENEKKVVESKQSKQPEYSQTQNPVSCSINETKLSLENIKSSCSSNELDIKPNLHLQNSDIMVHLEADIRKKLQKEFNKKISMAVSNERKVTKKMFEEKAEKNLEILKEIEKKKIALDNKLEEKEQQWIDRFEKNEEKWKDRLEKKEQEWKSRLEQNDERWKDRFKKNEEQWKDRLEKKEQEWKNRLEQNDEKWKDCLKINEQDFKLNMQQSEHKNANKVREQENELNNYSIKVKSMTDSMETLKQSLTQMKEVNDAQKQVITEMQEKFKANEESIETFLKKENLYKKKMDQMILIKEAKQLAFRALQKGRAVELFNKTCFLSSIFTDSIKHAFEALAINAFGEEIRELFLRKSLECGMMKQVRDSQSMMLIFRKEQMYLLSENERLMQEVAKLQEINETNCEKGMKKKEQIEEELTVGNFFVNDKLFQKNNDEYNVSCRLTIFFIIVKRIYQLSQFYVLFKFKKHVLEETESSAVEEIQERLNEIRVSAYADLSMKLGIMQIFCILKVWRCKTISFVFIKFHGKSTRNEMKDKIQFDEENITGKFGKLLNIGDSAVGKQVLKDELVSEVQRSQAKVEMFNIYSDANYLDHNIPLAHQPHYYFALPSVKLQRNRNAFIPFRQVRCPSSTNFPGSTSESSKMIFGYPLTNNANLAEINKIRRQNLKLENLIAPKTELFQNESIRRMDKEAANAKVDEGALLVTNIPSSPYEDTNISLAARAAHYRLRDMQQNLEQSIHSSVGTQNLKKNLCEHAFSAYNLY